MITTHSKAPSREVDLRERGREREGGSEGEREGEREGGRKGEREGGRVEHLRINALIWTPIRVQIKV